MQESVEQMAMQFCTKFSLLVSLLFVNLPMYADNENPAYSITYVNGYSTGRALAAFYAGGDKEQFLRGLLQGIHETGERVIDEDATREEKQRWFGDTKRSKKEQASYAAGYLSGDVYGEPNSLYSARVFVQGIMDSLQSADPRYVNKDQGSAIVTQYQRGQFYKMKREVAENIKVNERAGEAFLDNNALAPGVKQTNSGLQYRIISKGQGASPAATDKVRIALVGSKIDGQVFYNSQAYKLDNPTTIRVNQTLDGWQEALVKMSPGSEWELFLPSNLAYGNAGWQGQVEPGETLVYRLNLLEVIPAD
jgi:FKBP-type peptidyl-prolyl cis-trans isomerase FklB